MKKFIIITFCLAAIAVIVVAIAGFIRFNFTSGGDIIPGTNANVAQLICNNGYSAEAIYYSPNKNGVMGKLLLNVFKYEVKTQYNMIPALSASGSKFQVEGGQIYFWEHQEEFTLAEGEKVLAVCHKIPDATYTIEKKAVTLVRGLAEDETTKTITRYFGNDVKGDFSSDGREDIAFLLTQEISGGSPVYYLAVALGTDQGYQGANAILLGDRISPQSTMIDEQNPKQIIVSYGAPKSEGVETAMISRVFKVQDDQLLEIN